MDFRQQRALERRTRSFNLDELRRTHTLTPVNCKLSCPQLGRCIQAGSHVRLYGKDRAEVFFLFDAPSHGEVENGLPLVGKVGQIFRDQILRPFTQATANVSYQLSYLIKSQTTEDGKRFSKREYDTCWHHLMSDLGRHRPRLIVAFGSSVFQFLHGKAVNKRELDALLDGHTSMSYLRRRVFKFKFLDGYEPDVIVCYGPGFVLTTPTATRYLEEDRNRIIDAAKGRLAVCSTDRPSSLVKIEKIEVLRTLEAALNFLDRLGSGQVLSEPRPVAFDTETLNLNRRFNNSFLTWQFSYEPGCAVVVPIEHPDCPLFEPIDAKMKLVEATQRLFNTPSSVSNISMFVAHNAKFDLAVLYGLLGVIQRSPDAPFIWCTQNAAHWLDENRKGLARFMEAGDKPYSLKTLGKEFFNFRYRAEHLELRSDGNLVELSIDDLAEYGGSDTILTLALQAHQILLADEQPNGAREKLVHFMRHYYSKTNRSLALMECNGLYVSKTHLGHLQGAESPIWNRISEIKHGLLQNSPEVLDFRKKYSSKLSVKDSVAYDGLWGDESESDVVIELDIKKKTHRDAFYLDFLKVEPLEYSQKTKEPSFDAAFLEHYSKPENYKNVPGVRPYLAYYNTAKEDPKTGEPIYPPNPIQLIGELAKLEKLAAGYLNSMQKLLDDKAGDCRDSRVRASFHPTGTDTGRLSSCIAKGMLVNIVDKPYGIPIEYVKVGDLVYCYDNSTPPRLCTRPVLAAWLTGVSKVIRLHWNSSGASKFLDLTPDHRVRLHDGSYKEAQHLTSSDCILAAQSHDSLACTESLICIQKTENVLVPVPVYDLHVEEFYNFVVQEICVKNSSPNFQNLPAGRSKAAKEIKNMFQAEPPSKRWKEGTCLIQVDYAAAEVFWAVNFSREPELVKFLNKCAEDLTGAYENSDLLSDEEFEKIILSTDFHKRTASLMFEIGPEQVSKQMRQESKAITFGLLYGKTVQGLANDNGWTVEEAEAKMRKFFSAFPRLERWLKEQVETARNHGYVETLMGRRRRLSHFYATKQPKHAGEADRKAMNSPIQGQSSDAGIIGLNNFVEYVLGHELERRWLIENVVHDSILFQVPMQDVQRVLPVIKRCLTVGMREYIERHWNCVVPVTLRCDFEVGLRYGDLHGWDQRAKTLGPILSQIADDAKKLWHVKSNALGLKKPPIALDLVTWQGDELL